MQTTYLAQYSNKRAHFNQVFNKNRVIEMPKSAGGRVVGRQLLVSAQYLKVSLTY
jgi:hypothetical protein